MEQGALRGAKGLNQEDILFVLRKVRCPTVATNPFCPFRVEAGQLDSYLAFPLCSL